MINEQNIRQKLKEKEFKIPNNPLHFDAKLENQIFKASSNNKTLYILPTMHNACASMLSDECLDIISKSEILITEVHSENDDNENSVIYVDPNQENWLSILSPEEKNILDACLKSIDHDDNIEDYRFIPIKQFCEYLYSILIYNHGMDKTITEIYAESNKKIYGLDITEDNSELFNTEFEEYYNINYLKKIISILSGQSKYLAYTNELTDECPQYGAGILEEEKPEAKKIANVVGRNKNWITKILKILEDNTNIPCLLICGSNHLDSEYGILQLLFDNNFSIEQMDKNGKFLPYAPFLVPELLDSYRSLLATMDSFRTDALSKLNQQEKKFIDIKEKIAKLKP